MNANKLATVASGTCLHAFPSGDTGSVSCKHSPPAPIPWAGWIGDTLYLCPFCTPCSGERGLVAPQIHAPNISPVSPQYQFHYFFPNPKMPPPPSHLQPAHCTGSSIIICSHAARVWSSQHRSSSAFGPRMRAPTGPAHATPSCLGPFSSQSTAQVHLRVVRQAFQCIQGRIILAIIAAYGLGQALDKTGIAQKVWCVTTVQVLYSTLQSQYTAYPCTWYIHPLGVKTKS